MKKQEEKKKVIYEMDDFESHCHLWNIVPRGSGKAITLLRKIVDSILNNNYLNPYNRLPSILLVGRANTGKGVVSRATVNSLAIEDVREIPAGFLDNGIQSSQFFRDSIFNTAHIISHIENLNKVGESVLWRYLKKGECSYYNYVNRKFDLTQRSHGLIVMTARETGKLGTIRDAVDHVVELEPYSIEQQKLIVHQILNVFCGVNYVGGEMVLQEIVDQGAGMIGLVIDFLKICIMVMKAELLDCLDIEVVNKAKKIWMAPVGAPPPFHHTDDIPF